MNQDGLNGERIKKMNYKIIAVDFDGTLCENKWPDIGAPNHELIDYLKEEQKHGSKIILWTCRVGMKLVEAVTWCNGEGLFFDAVNENLLEAIEWHGGDSRKIFAHEYIDDRNCDKFLLPFNAPWTECLDYVLMQKKDLELLFAMLRKYSLM